MKRLLLLFIVPTLSYSQITYEDIMSINSLKTFKKVVIENGFEFDNDSLSVSWYGIDIQKNYNDESGSLLWSGYYKETGEFKFQFVIEDRSSIDDNYDISKHPYNLITEKIKKNCTFYDVINDEFKKDTKVDWVCYTCPQSKYKGKIGFTKYDGRSIIKHIIPTEEK